jgi:hypothetical protein
MARIRVATIQDVETINTTVNDLDNQVNATDTGLSSKVNALDNQVNEENSGLVARVTELEQGGVGITKIRTHSPSGIYESGEVVTRQGVLYRANAAMDGTSVSIAFTVGTSGQTWTPLDGKDYRSPLYFSSAAASHLATQLISNGGGFVINQQDSRDDGQTMALGFDADAKRLKLGIQGIAEQAALTSVDVMTYGDTQEVYKAKDEYPLDEVFCLGVIRVNEDNSVETFGFKYATPTIANEQSVTSASNMDYLKFDISNYMPSGMTIEAIWTEIAQTERDNLASINSFTTTDGASTEIRVYSVDNSDWSGDNVMGYDAQDMYIKVMCVASA